ncbi:hypothetical protein Tco_0669158 [Tanacetum coccineum]
MFKVFNRCLTSRLTSHDQIKINQKKNVIQYPRFTKLIIADIIETFESIPKRLEEDYHTIKDDTPHIRIMRQSMEGVEVPMIQLELVESTQGTYRTPRATKTPNHEVIQKRKRKGKQTAEETSSPRKSLKIRIKQQKPISTAPLPLCDDQERDNILEATQLNLALDKTAKAYEEQQNMAAIEKGILEEDVEKLVDEDKESKPESHKKNPEKINDDDDEEKKDDKKDDDDDNDDDDHSDHALIRTQRTGSSEIKTEKLDDAFRKRDHDEHQGEDAPPEREKSAKRQKTLKSSKSARVIDEDKVILDDKTPELIDEHKKVRNDPEEVFSDYGIIKVVKVTTDQQFWLDFIKRIVMIRENDKPYYFFEADFKCLNKNDIEDMYYLCLNKKVSYRKNKLLNSLLTFIKSFVIWERVHDFELGIESQQIKINLTAPTLTFPYIKARDPFFIADKPTMVLIYLNNKSEKRFMDLEEISKFCDATLEKMQKEVKMKIFKTEFIKKIQLLGSLDLKIMKAYEREIMKHLKYRKKMRR